MIPSRWFYEQGIADRLGVPRDELRYLRGELLKKNEWRHHGRETVLRESGLRRVLTFLGMPAAALSPDAFADHLAGAQLALPAPAVLELTVRNACRNPKLLNAIDPIDPKKNVRVRVADNGNFRPGMKLKAEPIPSLGGVYKLVGRCPRYVGRY